MNPIHKATYDHFKDFLGLAIHLISKMEWRNSPLVPWQQYAAQIGVAILRGGMSAHHLATSELFHGQAAVVRQTLELSNRFLFCLACEEEAYRAALAKERQQLRSIANLQQSSELFGDADAAARALDETLGRRPLLNEPSADGNDSLLSLNAKLAYKWLCLGAHERPVSLRLQYGFAVTDIALDLFAPANHELGVWQIKLCALALYESLGGFLGSKHYESAEKAIALARVGELFEPLALTAR